MSTKKSSAKAKSVIYTKRKSFSDLKLNDTVFVIYDNGIMEHRVNKLESSIAVLDDVKVSFGPINETISAYRFSTRSKSEHVNCIGAKSTLMIFTTKEEMAEVANALLPDMITTARNTVSITKQRVNNYELSLNSLLEWQKELR